jgi:RNA polymerase sigma factor (TIGR02999 family)
MSGLSTILETSAMGGRPHSGELLPLIYDELRSLAATKLMRGGREQTLQATALVHEAWLRLGGDEAQEWNDSAHFFRAAALAMRSILVDRARQKAALKHGGAHERIHAEHMDLVAATQDERILLVDDALERFELEHPVRAQVVILKYFGGLTNKEIARVQGVAEKTVERHWAFAKARLFELINDQEDENHADTRQSCP